MKMKQTENEVKKAIKEYLEYNKYTVYRINNAGGYRGDDTQGKPRFSFAGTPGVADLYAVKKGDYPLWIEAKATGKTPSNYQLTFGVCVNASFGTFWIWADSLEMFVPKFLGIVNNKGQWDSE